ncbi:MAG: hypothetical protein OXF79_24980 [Chloroflexi bacterium]|nr:hypothetical protein [Chloroflexota bacterium]
MIAEATVERNKDLANNPPGGFATFALKHCDTDINIAAVVRPLIGLGTTKVPCLADSQLDQSRQLAGHYPGTTVVRTIQLGEVGIAKQLAPQRRHQSIEGVPTHRLRVQMVRFPPTPLVRSFAQRRFTPLRKLKWPGV